MGVAEQSVRGFAATALALAAWAAPAPAAAQPISSDPFENPELDVAAAAEPDAAQLAFKLLAEIALPGPLPGPGPRLGHDAIEIAVAGGTAQLPLLLDQPPRIETSTGPAPEPPAETRVEGRRGEVRFRADPEGWLRAERRCDRCSHGWKKDWKLRAPGLAPAAPLVVGKQVCFGSLDNSVTCVRTRNGHRRWSVDVGGRVLEPLVYWPGSAPAEGAPRRKRSDPGPDGVLAVIEHGAELVVLAADRGKRRASLSFTSGNGRLVHVPLATADGRVIVARQGYAEADASLRVYALQAAPPPVLPPTPATGEHATEAGAAGAPAPPH